MEIVSMFRLFKQKSFKGLQIKYNNEYKKIRKFL